MSEVLSHNNLVFLSKLSDLNLGVASAVTSLESPVRYKATSFLRTCDVTGTRKLQLGRKPVQTVGGQVQMKCHCPGTEKKEEGGSEEATPCTGKRVTVISNLNEKVTTGDEDVSPRVSDEVLLDVFLKQSYAGPCSSMLVDTLFHSCPYFLDHITPEAAWSLSLP